MKDLELWRKPTPLRPLIENMRGVMESLGRKAERMLSASAEAPSVQETDRNVVVSARILGFEKDDIEVSVSGHALTIRGEKKAEASDRKHGVAGLARGLATFHQTVALPAEVRAEEAKATFREGWLSVELTKVQETKTRKIAIQ